MATMSLDYNFSVLKNMKCGISEEQIDTQTVKARKGLAKLSDMVKSKEVGFTELPYQNTDEMKSLAKDLSRKYNDLIVIGIGGSALGFEAIANAMLPHGYNSLSFTDRRSFPRYWLLDNADPSLVNSVLKYCNQEDTFAIVISKSGSTVETAVNFALVYEWFKLKTDDMKKHFLVITDPEKGTLRDFANEKGVRSLPLPDNVGGRFSVLSPVGLLPVAILGIDIDKILGGAAKIVESDWKQFLTMAAIYMHFMDQKRAMTALMPYSSRLIKFAEWFCQLWGESLGKYISDNGNITNFGNTPLRLTGSVDQHSQLQLLREGPDDKFLTFIGLVSHECDKMLKGDMHSAYSYLTDFKMGDILNSELKATEAAIATLGRPSMKLELTLLDEDGLGQLFMIFQYVVAIIGLANDINPFDQPGVEEGKDFTYGLMGRSGYEEKKAQFDKIYVKKPEFII
ncbi:MAG: glucose-6-phosphate isomerase [Deferribacteraceae bacterium]|jgi:glucose-6-phosphate isomerase|nr:glucose-6-phosphate isomerase [Deferribacteraceae bacterium]